MTLPGDGHVHSEWSWDTGGPTNPEAIGTMQRTCERAVRIGLPALAFTEHFDFGSWPTRPADMRPHLRSVIADGVLTPPHLDIPGYLESIARARQQFPELTILTGVEFGEPHLYPDEAAALVELGVIDRINGSLHRIPMGGQRSEPGLLMLEYSPAEVMWAYLEELPRMVAGSDVFEVFTHIDWVARYWPVEAQGPFDPRPFEEGFRPGCARSRPADGRSNSTPAGCGHGSRSGGARKAAARSRSAATRTCRRPWPTVCRRRRRWRSTSASAQDRGRRTSGRARPRR